MIWGWVYSGVYPRCAGFDHVANLLGVAAVAVVGELVAVVLWGLDREYL